jgi:dihydropteroate synthase
MLMGIGNLTELTAADSTGVNAMLVAICQELGVRTVLTTEVIGWARGAVREVDIARRLMYDAVTRHAIPKDVDDRLVTLRDARVVSFSPEELRELQQGITDANFRIFTDSDGITVLNDEILVRGTDVGEIFSSLGVDEPTHAFYLGRELTRASLAVMLGKTYRQDDPLDWGYLTPSGEDRAARVRLTGRSGRRKGPPSSRS